MTCIITPTNSSSHPKVKAEEKGDKFVNSYCKKHRAKHKTHALTQVVHPLIPSPIIG
jgi:hypothetical protein